MQALHDIKGHGPTLGPPKTERAVRTVPVAEPIAARLAAHIDENVANRAATLRELSTPSADSYERVEANRAATLRELSTPSG